MTTLREQLDEYLVMRRSLGFQLDDLERQVGLFCAWLEARGQTLTFSIDDAVTWARLNPDAHPSWWATRLSLVRRFAAYLNANDVDVPVIPGGLLQTKKPRAVPFIPTSRRVLRSTRCWTGNGPRSWSWQRRGARSTAATASSPTAGPDSGWCTCRSPRAGGCSWPRG
jgi:hypothetical protein